MNDGATKTPVLVIGYGNELRSDDGVGPRAARAVAGWQLPHVQALALHQLTPELAEVLAEAATVVFVDAGTDPVSFRLRVQPLQPERDAIRPGHLSDPRWLLALTRQLFGATPPAQLLTIRAENLNFGTSLSPSAEHGLDEALCYINHLVNLDDKTHGPI
jgi:hydrogenase maturation protease